MLIVKIDHKIADGIIADLKSFYGHSLIRLDRASFLGMIQVFHNAKSPEWQRKYSGNFTQFTGNDEYWHATTEEEIREIIMTYGYVYCEGKQIIKWI